MRCRLHLSNKGVTSFGLEPHVVRLVCCKKIAIFSRHHGGRSLSFPTPLHTRMQCAKLVRAQGYGQSGGGASNSNLTSSHSVTSSLCLSIFDEANESARAVEPTGKCLPRQSDLHEDIITALRQLLGLDLFTALDAQKQEYVTRRRMLLASMQL